MSSIVIWINKEYQLWSIWAVADTRISKTTEPTHSTLHDLGAKLFSIQYNCEDLSVRPEQRRFYLQGSIGLAYAGSSAVGLGLYSAISPLLRRLGNKGTMAKPRIEDIGVLAAKILTNYLRMIGEKGICECALYGYCPFSRNFKIFHIVLDRGCEPLQFRCIPFQQMDNDFLVLGNYKEYVRHKINEFRQDKPLSKGGWWRAPRYVLPELISDPNYPSIGGSLQLSISSGLNTENYYVCVPIGDGTMKAKGVYLGLDVFDEPQMIGDCFISMHGMT